METRGNPSSARRNGRPTISRRSCDHCRSRKIACDRGSPCANCVSAQTECIHSAIAARTTAPKQRVLISEQYEKKIDSISRDVDDIKRLLQGLNGSVGSTPAVQTRSPGNTDLPATRHPLISAHIETPSWDHSSQVIDFVKAVITDHDSNHLGPQASQVVSSLKSLVTALESPGMNNSLPPIGSQFGNSPETQSASFLEAVTWILAWASDHRDYSRIVWIGNILPFEQFTRVCRKVYSDATKYNILDLVIANGFLSYLFAEHAAVYGNKQSREMCAVCRSDLISALSQLPLLLPPSMEAVAALTLGCLNAIEDSQATKAWTFISNALSMCQSLGYHRRDVSGSDSENLRVAQTTLFWTVYSFSNGLSLRLKRAISLHENEVTIPPRSDEPWFAKVARVQGKAYSQLYNRVELPPSGDELSSAAYKLLKELDEIIEDTRTAISNAASHLGQPEGDPMKIVYFHSELVCQSSLYVLILRSITASPGSPASEKCVAAARNTLDLHQQCMEYVNACKDPLVAKRYLNWAIQHVPFVPFSILFTRTVQLSDRDDLARLEAFSSSLKPEMDEAGSITHPYRLYKHLCQAARLAIDPATLGASIDPSSQSLNNSSSWHGDEKTLSSNTPSDGLEFLEADDFLMPDFSDWCFW